VYSECVRSGVEYAVVSTTSTSTSNSTRYLYDTGILAVLNSADAPETGVKLELYYGRRHKYSQYSASKV